MIRTRTFWLLLASLLCSQVQSQSFDDFAEVLRHPRCMNCHTVTDYPRQTDARIRHIQRVVRGADGFGAPTLRCYSCHQDHNTPDGAVPGAHNWHLAPLSMGWENLTTNRELCEAVTDRSKNGGRSVEMLVEHMTGDKLVAWAWTPGGDRIPPRMEKSDFDNAVKAWGDAVKARGPASDPCL